MTTVAYEARPSRLGNGPAHPRVARARPAGEAARAGDRRAVARDPRPRAHRPPQRLALLPGRRPALVLRQRLAAPSRARCPTRSSATAGRRCSRRSACVAGPNLVPALPAIVLFNVLVLMPVALLCIYGIAQRIGGRIFAYWATFLWIAVPFIGIKFTDAGYHQRYTELTLPQSFGLTAMADFPSMVAVLVVASTSPSGRSTRATRVDAVACGLAAGVAIAIKPSNSIFLARRSSSRFAYRRRFVAAAYVAAGLAPALLDARALEVPRARLPAAVPCARASDRLALGAALGDRRRVNPLHKYIQLDWHQLHENLLQIKEHFWSMRVVEWLVLAGLIGLARRSLTAVLLVGGWFAAFVVVKGTYANASINDASVFRIMMPSFPAFVLLLASLVYLLPRTMACDDRRAAAAEAATPGRASRSSPRPAPCSPSSRSRSSRIASPLHGPAPRAYEVERPPADRRPVAPADGDGRPAAASGCGWNPAQPAGTQGLLPDLAERLAERRRGLHAGPACGRQLPARDGRPRAHPGGDVRRQAGRAGRGRTGSGSPRTGSNSPDFGDVFSVGPPVTVRRRADMSTPATAGPAARRGQVARIGVARAGRRRARRRARRRRAGRPPRVAVRGVAGVAGTSAVARDVDMGRRRRIRPLRRRDLAGARRRVLDARGRRRRGRRAGDGARRAAAPLEGRLPLLGRGTHRDRPSREPVPRDAVGLPERSRVRVRVRDLAQRDGAVRTGVGSARRRPRRGGRIVRQACASSPTAHSRCSACWPHCSSSCAVPATRRRSRCSGGAPSSRSTTPAAATTTRG